MTGPLATQLNSTSSSLFHPSSEAGLTDVTQRASLLITCWPSCSGSPQLSHLLSINFQGPLRMTQTFLSPEKFQVLKGYFPGTGDRPAQIFITQDTDSRFCILYRKFFPFLREIITKTNGHDSCTMPW